MCISRPVQHGVAWFAESLCIKDSCLQSLHEGRRVQGAVGQVAACGESAPGSLCTDRNMLACVNQEVRGRHGRFGAVMVVQMCLCLGLLAAVKLLPGVQHPAYAWLGQMPSGGVSTRMSGAVFFMEIVCMLC
jgi:hypothetical protein